MKTSKPRRTRKPAKRLDSDPLRELFRDGRVWAELGTVEPVGNQAHYRVIQGDGGKIDAVMVDVLLHPSGNHVSARLGSGAGGAGRGLWRIPAKGTEVAVLVPAGALDFVPVIVATLDSGDVPSRVSEGRTILVATDELELIVGGRTLRVKDGEIQLGASAVEQIIKGTGYRAAEDAMLTPLQAALAALQAAATGPLSPLQPGFTSAATALATFISTLASNVGFLSTKSKTE